jgi:hypothetical protein
MGYRVISYEEARELLKREDYKCLVGRSEFESYANFCCRKVGNNELECVKIWANWRTGGKGGAVFTGSPEEIYVWIPWDMKGTIAPVRVETALWRAFGINIDWEKVDEAYRSVLRKVLGVR